VREFPASTSSNLNPSRQVNSVELPDAIASNLTQKMRAIWLEFGRAICGLVRLADEPRVLISPNIDAVSVD
jgi:hypothetical protein